MRVIRWRKADTGVESLTITANGVYFPVGKTDSGFKLKLSMASAGQSASVDIVRSANGDRAGYTALSVSGTTEVKSPATLSLSYGIVVSGISGTLNATLDDETPITTWPKDSLGRFTALADLVAHTYGSVPPVGLVATVGAVTYFYNNGWKTGNTPPNPSTSFANAAAMQAYLTAQGFTGNALWDIAANDWVGGDFPIRVTGRNTSDFYGTPGCPVVFDGVELEFDAANVWRKSLTGNACVTSGVMLMSESILAVGEFPDRLAAKLGVPTYSDAVIGGSHASLALFALASRCVVPAYSDNLCAYSSDLTATGWTALGGAAASKQTIGNQLWSRVVRISSNAGDGMRYTFACPASGGELLASAKVLIPEDYSATGKAYTLQLNVRNMNTGNGIGSSNIVTIPAGVECNILARIPKSLMSALYGTGINLALEVRIYDSGASNIAMYVKDVTISSRAPYGYAPPVATNGAAITGTSLSNVDIAIDNPKFTRADAIIISFGRNDANEGIPADAYQQSMVGIISCASKVCANVIASNPPCQVIGGVWSEEHYLSEFKKAFARISTYSSESFDVNSWITRFIPSDVMNIRDGLSQHQNSAGSELMATVFTQKVFANRSVSHIPDTSAVAIFDCVTDVNWTDIVEANQNLLTYRTYYAESATKSLPAKMCSVVGGKITYSLPSCTQIGVMLQSGVGRGTFGVYCDGVKIGVVDCSNATISTPYSLCRTVAHGLPKKSRTLELVVESGTVVISAVVAF